MTGLDTPPPLHQKFTCHIHHKGTPIVTARSSSARSINFSRLAKRPFRSAVKQTSAASGYSWQSSHHITHYSCRAHTPLFMRNLPTAVDFCAYRGLRRLRFWWLHFLRFQHPKEDAGEEAVHRRKETFWVHSFGVNKNSRTPSSSEACHI